MGKAEKTQLLIVRGMIASAPDADQAKVKECHGKIKEVIASYGDHGMMAFALVGAEIAEAAED